LESLTLWALVTLVVVLFLGLLMLHRRRRVVTWDGGYARPTARMQYSASSFAQSIVRLFAWVLKPEESGPPVRGTFPQTARWASHVNEVVLDRVLVPGARRLERLASWFRRFQQGLTQNYVAYILITLLGLLGFLVPYGDIVALWTAR